MKKLIVSTFYLCFLLVLTSCQFSNEIIFEFVDQPKVDRLTINLNDPTALVDTYTSTTIVNVNFYSDFVITKWCVSESQTTKPDTTCTGGAGPSSGWYLTAPTTFILGAGDGSKDVYFWAELSSGKIRAADNVYSINLDTSDPAVAVTSPAINYTINQASQTNFVVNGTCSEEGRSVVISGAVSSSTICSGGNFNISLDITSVGEGTFSLTFDHQDNSGNDAPSFSRNFIKDSLPPNLTQVDFLDGNDINTSTVAFGGTCEAGQTISISGTDTATTACGAGAWSYITNAQGVDGSYSYTFSQSDPVGNTQSFSHSWQRDTVIPIVNSLDMNSTATVTKNNNVLITFNASSNRADIHSFCLKYNDTSVPSISDSCWITLDSVGDSVTDNYTITDYPYQIGSILGTYEVRVWVKDSANNLSAMSNAGNGTTLQDLDSIFYNPDPAPLMSNLIAASNDTPSSPLTSGDTTITIGNDIYVKWEITDNNAIPSGNIDLYYTTDDVNFTLLQAGLNNGVNGACSISGSETGCALISTASPTSSFYKIRVEVQDSGVSKVVGLTNALNTGKVNFLAGNTSLGLGGSATGAIIRNAGETGISSEPDANSFVVTKTGYIFMRHDGVGLVYISPEDGLIRLLAPDTNTISGDGGSVFSATIADVFNLAIDPDGNIIFWDFNRIRKIDLSTAGWPISTIAGGGADTSSGVNALSASLPLAGLSKLLTITPNGRIYYDNGKSLWYYNPGDQTVNKLYDLTGMGANTNTGVWADFDHSACAARDRVIAFNKSTSAITKVMSTLLRTPVAECGNGSNFWGPQANFNVNTGLAEAPHPPTEEWNANKFTGMNGAAYVIKQYKNKLKKFDIASNDWIDVLGNGENGRCADGTAALSCPLSIQAAFVNEFGKIYFIDMGIIRTVNNAGNVVTIAGQPRNFGEGKNPLSARFSKVAFFDVAGDEVYVKNKLEHQIMNFSLTGGNLKHIAGNGGAGGIVDLSTATSVGLQNCNWNMPCGFGVDSGNNRLYHRVGARIFYIDLSTGLRNELDHVIQETGTRPSILGVKDIDTLLVYAPTHFGPSGDKVTLREFDASTPADTIVYGRTDILTPLDVQYCTGVNSLTCTVNQTQTEEVQTTSHYDTNTNSWFIAYRKKNRVTSLPEGGGIPTTLEFLDNTIRAFDYRKDGANEYIFYCATDGKLYKRDIVGNIETELTFPTPNMQCDGMTVKYHVARDSVLFIYYENGMYGIAEYTNP